MTHGMILAAGLGTRLGGLSAERPKPLMPVLGAPLVRWAGALLAAHGIRDVVVNLHHLGLRIREELGDGSSLGLHVRYSPEDSILGTGGGIRRALRLLGDGQFVVVNGKILADLDLGDVLAYHRASGAAATLVVKPEPEARRWGAVDAPPDGGPIRALRGEGDFMWTGVQVLDPALVARLPDDGAARCIVGDGHMRWLAEGVPIHAYVTRGYFREHSTPARLLEGNLAALRGEADRVPRPPGALSTKPRTGTGSRSAKHRLSRTS